MKNNFLLLFLLITLYFNFSFAESESVKKNKSPYPTLLTSSTDETFTLTKITLLTAEDNLQNIYSEPAFLFLADKIKYDPFWSYAEPLSNEKINEKIKKLKFSAKNQNQVTSFLFDRYESQPELVQQMISENSIDAFLALKILKGPKGISVFLNLFSKDRGLLLSRVELNEPKVFEVSRVNEMVDQAYQQIKQQMPFSGLITSRNGQKITVNVGTRRGLHSNQTLPIIQIIKVNRHPKLNFMTSVEKEIIGKILITDAQEESSYGEITLEVEPGVIKIGSKLLSLTPTSYEQQAPQDVSQVLPRDKNAFEWLPAKPPQFGKATLLAGLTLFEDKAVLSTSTQVSATDNLGLSFLVGAELWITPELYSSIDFKQDSLKATNSFSGSSPSKLNYTIRTTDFNFGYRYHIDGLFWGPNLFASLGYLTQSLSVTDTTPTSFTSHDLTGVSLTAGGYFPITRDNDVAVGAQVKLMLSESLSESPVSSGGANPKYNRFDLLGYYQYTTNINIKAMMSFATLQSSFNESGDKTPASRSLDEKNSSYLMGIEYLF